MGGDTEAAAVNYDATLKWKGLTPLDQQVPLPVLQRDIRERFPSLIASSVVQPHAPVSLSLAQIGVDRPQSDPNLPLHPTIVEWPA